MVTPFIRNLTAGTLLLGTGVGAGQVLSFDDPVVPQQPVHSVEMLQAPASAGTPAVAQAAGVPDQKTADMVDMVDSFDSEVADMIASLPELEVPALSVPELAVPALSVPELAVPELAVPEVGSMPELPAIADTSDLEQRARDLLEAATSER